ncbi:hypothetical protein ACH9L7_05425 [Haloferax sp. S1W]|uniref:hypothetical protein n=1 Tax=Haloferax sp. S1W TaxID=3377110 RepID=UPI0037CB5DA2
MKYCDETPSVASMLGRNMIDPKYANFVEAVMNGDDDGKPESFVRASLRSEWQLEAIIDRDGEENLPGGGGVDMAPLKMPVQRVLQETRLQHDLKKGEMWRCSECNVGVYDTLWMARHLVEEHGLDRLESADHVLHVEDYFDKDRECMRHPAGGD